MQGENIILTFDFALVFCGPGGSRTLIRKADNILSVACIPFHH